MFGIMGSTARNLKEKSPKLFRFFFAFAKKYFGKFLGVYPRPLSHEICAIKKVLYSGEWNMAYGKGLEHEKLEEEFAKYVGTSHAIAVNTGGMALQMSMRALGLRPGHEVIMQVDTCSATASAVMNAGCTPIFADISPESFMLSKESLTQAIGVDTKAILATHMWGNTEDMQMVSSLCKEKNLFVIEDACLSLGAHVKNKMVGSTGHVGVFSFGCLKPIQAGEGGMIVTNDDALARELRSLRHWGDRSLDFGIRDVTQLAWNGRMSEILAALIRQQLKGYPRYLKDLRERVLDFQNFLSAFEGFQLILGASHSVQECAFTQVVLKMDEARSGISKEVFRKKLAEAGVSTWHANFEAINSLSFFKGEAWKEWVLKGNKERITQNYTKDFANSRKIFESTGLGISKNNFQSFSRLSHLKKQLSSALIKGNA